MAPALVGTPDVVVITTASTAWSIPITSPSSGQMLAVFISVSLGPSSAVSSVTDNGSPGGTYILSGKGGQTGITSSLCYLAIAYPTGSPTTLTVNVTSGTGKVCVARFSGMNSGSPPSTGFGTPGGAASATTLTSPAYTGAGNGDLVLGVISHTGATTNARTLQTGSGGWSRLDSLATYTDTVAPHIGTAWKIASSAGASEQHSWTVGTSASAGFVTGSAVPTGAAAAAAKTLALVGVG